MAYLLTGYDTARIGSLKVHVADGADSGVATLATNTYCHRDLSSVTGSGTYTTIVSTLASTTLAILVSNGDQLDATFDASTLKWTIGYATGGSNNHAIDFRNATIGDDSGKRLAALLGFDYTHTNASGGSASDPYDILLSGTPLPDTVESNVTPYYALALAKDGPSKFSRPFEVAGQTKRGVSVNGTAYSVRPTTREKRVRFDLMFQTLAATFAAEASASAPWTYEDLLDHIGALEPVLLSYTGGDIIYQMIDPEFSEDARSSAFGDYHGRWHLRVEGQYLGAL